MASVPPIPYPAAAGNIAVHDMTTLFDRFEDHFLQNLLGDSFTILVLTIAARAGWGIAYWGWRFLRFYLSPAVAQFPIQLGRLTAIAETVALDPARIKVFCQIVRFGADDYIQNLANEQEKFEGRLQNRVLPVTMGVTDDGYAGHLLLPVHRRLGTQFKMFLVTESSALARTLMDTEYFKDARRNATRRGRRISFTLADVDTIQNTERTVTNNMMYPSNLHDFTEWNSFGPAYLTIQRWRWRHAQRRRGRDGGRARGGTRGRPDAGAGPGSAPPPVAQSLAPADGGPASGGGPGVAGGAQGDLRE